ncbi:hypothetical protein QFC21_006885 [Naganishia friedmannii]|uniref:Uncharacterized protein n=1 Tax=Naganishia friedmannii TaxID=89922 RepID=A0ACC2UZX4_9TREE|nr:hypothetical protein QFC21_006885 [Naganishia friedmannii]
MPHRQPASETSQQITTQATPTTQASPPSIIQPAVSTILITNEAGTQTIVVTEGGGVVTSTALGSAPAVTQTPSGQGGNAAPAVITQYVTARVTGTDAQGRTTTGESLEQVILTVTATAAGGSRESSVEPQVVTLTATNANQRATGGVVIVTLTESATSTEADGNQVIVVKTITSSIRYTRAGSTATIGSSGSLQTASSATSRPSTSRSLCTLAVGLVSASFVYGATVFF